MADLSGTGAGETIQGTDEDDVIRPSAGVAQVLAGAGDDIIVLPAGDGSQLWGALLDGSDGNDTIDGSAITGNLRLVDAGTPDLGIPVTTVSGVEHVIGGSGSDIVVMLYDQAGISIAGGAGNDILIGGAGNDQIDGGSGTDISGFLSLYRSAAFDGDTVTTVRGGTDHLQNVEYSLFEDGLYTVDPNSSPAQITRLYEGLFGHAPTSADLDTQVHALEHGASLQAIAGNLATASDALGISSEHANSAFVDDLYQTILGREADTGGRANWIGALDGGVSREAVVIGFTDSDEFRAKTADVIASGLFVTDEASQGVAALYDAANGHAPGQAEFEQSIQDLKTGMVGFGQIADGLAASDSFTSATAGMSNAELVDYMYETALHRTADAGGKVNWTTALDNGLSHGQLVEGFALSTEHLQLISPDIHGGIAVQADPVIA